MRIFVPANDFFAFVLQGERQAELRADAIAIGPDVADDAKRPALANAFEDAINDFRMRLHSIVASVSTRTVQRRSGREFFRALR